MTGCSREQEMLEHWMHFHKRVQGLALQMWSCRSRTERRAAVSVLVCGSTPLVTSRKC
jgi:hypothetical protein